MAVFRISTPTSTEEGGRAAALRLTPAPPPSCIGLPTMNGRRHMGRWYDPARDAEPHDPLPVEGHNWRCRCCRSASRLVGIQWCHECVDVKIAERKEAPRELLRRREIARRLAEIDAALHRGDFDAVSLRRWFAWIDTARRFDLECTLPTTLRLVPAMIATLEAVPIRVAAVLPFRSPRAFENKVEEYLGAGGEHRPIVVIGLPAGGDRQLVDGRHRMSAALILKLETVPAVFAMYADPRRWGDGGCW